MFRTPAENELAAGVLLVLKQANGGEGLGADSRVREKAWCIAREWPSPKVASLLMVRSFFALPFFA